jgi:hypothetical protein
VRVGAVAGQDHDERLGVRGIGLDVDLARRDVDEVTRGRIEAPLDAGRTPGVGATPDRM